jgi:hypothetical protein
MAQQEVPSNTNVILTSPDKLFHPMVDATNVLDATADDATAS